MSTRQIEREEEKESVVTPIKSVDESESVEERLTQNTLENILPARYLKKNEDGVIVEDAAAMFERVASNVGLAEVDEDEADWDEFNEWSDEFYKQMSELRFMPNSPTLMNAGLDLQQLSACFVNSPSDDLSDIFQTSKEAAEIFKSGGGMGYSFSRLRPKGALVSSTKGVSSGPLSFMEVFDTACQTVKQGGKRRGAQMAIMRADHPDIGRFVVAKRNEGDFSNFNISVGFTDDFIEAVEDDGMYTLYKPQSDFTEAFEVVEETKQFYLPEHQDSSEQVVGENLWRDHADSIEAYDWESGETVNFREKWEDAFKPTYEVHIIDEYDRVCRTQPYFDEERLERTKELWNTKTVKKVVAEPAEYTLDGAMELPARFIFDIIVDGSWRNGEPGYFHLDETNRQHSFDIDAYPDHEIYATNPCAEQPLEEYEACNLGHINLSLILRENSISFEEYIDEAMMQQVSREEAVEQYFADVVDFSNLDRTIEAGVRFLDNVVTQSDFPLEEIEHNVSNKRKIGLGVMGFAQLLYQMGIEYGSPESYEVARNVMRYIDRQATYESHRLAKQRGSFGEWGESKYANPTEYKEWFESHTGLPASDYPDGYEMRNHNVTTVAPTGTTSMIGDTSGGIEPVFNVAYYKNVGKDIQGDTMLVEFDDYFLQTLEANDVDIESVKRECLELMDSNDFDSIQQLDTVPEDLKSLFVTTNDISTESHMLMQRAFQEFNDSGISKTINLPYEATHKDVFDAFMLGASEDALGAVSKGFTVYRNDSRKDEVMKTTKNSEKELEEAKELLEDNDYTVVQDNE